MSDFFDRLQDFLEGTTFIRYKPSTATGLDLFAKGQVKVTVNYVASQDRVSVKLTVPRETPNGSTPRFDGLRAKYESHTAAALDGESEWKADSGSTESRLQTQRTISEFTSERELCGWVETQARTLRRWTDETS